MSPADRRAALVDLGRMEYGEALALQERLVALRQRGRIGDAVLLVEHPPVLTLGVRGDRAHILASEETLARAGVSVFPVGRGGDVTYHGPGQIVGYPILHLPSLGLGVKEYVHALEDAVIALLHEDFGIEAGRAEAKYTGVWVGDRKICAIGIAVRHGVAMHGFAFNVDPDLSHFDWIVPCGLADRGVTSVARELGRPVDVAAVRARLAGFLARSLDLALVRADRDAFAADLPPLEDAVPPALAEAVAAAEPPHRKPEWLRIPPAPTEGQGDVRRALGNLKLHTVCQEAACPNLRECFGRGTATFLILGDTCTRDCTFCAISRGHACAPDPDEPAHVAEAVRSLGLTHVVVTSVTRDDLPDGGAAHFAATIRAVRAASPDTTIEVLIPDFQGDADALAAVLDARPDVLNHNVETVPRLYPEVRPSARYARSLELLRRAADSPAGAVVKSGLMVGLGETYAEMAAAFRDLRDAGVASLTVGQYLAPSKAHHPVVAYIPPAVFDAYREEALALGFLHVASGPFVRSSYRAEEAVRPDPGGGSGLGGAVRGTTAPRNANVPSAGVPPDP